MKNNNERYMEEEHMHIKDWAYNNDQTVNEKKTKLSVFRRPRGKVNADVSGCQIEHVENFKLLGVMFDDRLTFTLHITDVLSTCSQRLYLLKLLRDKGMPLPCLHVVYVSLVVNKITYCISAWGGFIRELYVNKIDSLFRKAKKYGFTTTLYDFRGLMLHHDENLYHSIICDNHCLNHLLPSSRTNILSLRDRGHAFELPKCRTDLYKCSYVPRHLYNTM